MKLTRSLRLLGVSCVGAGLALFLQHKLGAFASIQASFDGPLQVDDAFAMVRSIAGAAAGALMTWRFEARQKRMALGEAVILAWFGVFSFSYLLSHFGVPGIPVVSFSISALAGTFGLYAARSVFNEDDRARLANAFRSYVSPALVDELVKSPEALKLESERKELTIFFSDIQNFTSLSEKLPPDELMATLNRYFSGVTEIVFRHGGTLDKFMGDGVMAFWNAPTDAFNHQRLATLAAIDVDKFSCEFFKDISARTGLALSTRVGLNTGEVHVGNFGSTSRFTYTAVGDEANLAARIEPLNTRYKTLILLSGSTAERCDDVSLLFVDEVIVKGRSKPVRLYTPATSTVTEAAATDLNLRYESAFAKYQAGFFAEAAVAFESFLEIYPTFSPAEALRVRCHDLVKTPPLDWDGVFRFTEKF
ncbi:hypothetical protein BH10BDE1_BH10BDE1_16860 [soil metagenome]